LNIGRLIEIQRKISGLVRITPLKKRIATIAGGDVAQRGNFLYASVVLCSFPGFELIEEHHAKKRASIPYVPGFLSFRELPVMEKAYGALTTKPSLILVDGQGIAHPRRLGLASHLGVVLQTPTIGCAKSHLHGQYTMPGLRRGAFRYLRDGRLRVGLVLRTRDKVKPLYVSPGHLVDLEDCLRIVLSTAVKYRIPEPLRLAHKTAGLWAKSE
jgi:deoxyribonuclease V